MLERFEGLVDQHQDRVYTLARYLLRDPEEAADVTQEVLLRLWRHMGSVEEDAGPWLMRVTRNRCFDLLRRRRTERNVLGEPTDPEALERARISDPSPEHLATSSELGAELRRAVDELGEPYRSVVLLREVQQLKYREISEVLDMPLNTVKVNIHRARQQLRDRLREVIGHAAVG